MRTSLICATIGAALSCGANAGYAQGTDGDGCRLGKNGVVAGSRAGVCAQLLARWTLLAGAAPPLGEVRFVARSGFDAVRGDSSWALLWPAPRAGSPETAYHIANTIPHEAGHALFEVGMPGSLRARTEWRYSTNAPDWFDEAPAIWMESDSMRAFRVSSLRGTRPSLGRILAMPHPSLLQGGVNQQVHAGFRIISQTAIPPCKPCTWLADSLRSKYRVTSVRAFTDGRTDTVTTWHDDDPRGPARLEEREFYALAYSLLAFIHDRGGPKAFHELVARYAADPTPRGDVLNGLPGLPDSFEQIERDWHSFLGGVR